MKKIYDKNELNFALIWIGLYVVLAGVADSISDSIGVVKSITAPLFILLSVFMYLWICKQGLKEKYGLRKFSGNKKVYLYFIPLAFLATTNIWFGIKMNLSIWETIFYILSMLCVGFLEEVIFRGFLFKAICKSNVKQAIVISSITFGFGHIVNLLNGKDIPETLMQICYACAIGFLFTIIFYKGKSLYPCIITHSVINSLSVFANRENENVTGNIVSCIFLCVVPICYSLYIIKHEAREEKTSKGI